jgi:phosphoglycolate phosphatase
MKGVFFDWDGTLVDSLPLLFAAHNHVRGELGYPLWTREEYAKAIVYSTRELYPKIYGDRAQEAQDKLYGYIKENHIREMKILEGAPEVVDYLSRHNVPIGIVSNKRHDVLQAEVEHLGWHGYFGVYQGAGVAKLDKPSGEPLLHALRQHKSGLGIGDIIYVGDTESDLSCAREAGCPCIFIRHSNGHEELISRYKPAYVVDTLAELKERLIEIFGHPA